MHSRLRPSPAMFVAPIALFVALGGSAAALSGSNTVFTDDLVNDQVRSVDVRDDSLTSGGLQAVDLRPGSVGSSEVATESLVAGDLAPSSVGTSEVADNSLTGADVADDSLNGGDINESSLGIVPNADQLDGTDASGFVQSQGATFTDAGLPDEVGGGCPSGANGWYNHGAASGNRVGYHRDPFGFVHLRGQARTCGIAGTVVFTLPLGYRPANREYQTVPSTFALTAVGTVSIFSTGEVAHSSTGVSLDGMTFRCGPSGQNGCP